MHLKPPCKPPFLKRRGFAKTLLIMKLIAIFLFAACLQVSANGYSQRITLSQANSSLKSIFREIENQSGYQFFYKEKLLKQAGKVTINVTNASLEDVLDKCFKGQQLTYAIVDKIIVLKEKPAENTNREPVPVQIKEIITITGVVISDSTGQPLRGASVKLKGTNIGTATDENGSFTLKVTATTGILVVSYVGYQTIEIPVSKAGNAKIALKAKPVNIEDVVVVAFGTQKKTSLTSAVAEVKGEEMTRRPVSNAQQALQGIAPGITVLDRGGAPGRSGATIRVRGVTTLATNNDPLVIVDGIEQQLYDINPADIESISLLKDASSTAIYGSRAANGVLLITTKRAARNGKISVSYSGYYAVQKTMNKPEMMDLEPYMREQVVAYTNANAAVPARFSDQSIKDWVSATDRYKYPLPNTWFQTVFHAAPQYSNTVAVSGGNEVLRARMSVRYQDQDGIIPNTENRIREIRVNSDFNASKKLKFTADVNYRYNYSATPAAEGDVFNRLFHGSLWAVPKYPNGTYGLSPQGANPLMLAEISGKFRQYADYIVGNLKGEWEITKGLNFSVQFGARINSISQKNFSNAYTNKDSITGITKIVANNSLTEVRNTVREYTTNVLLNYQRSWEKHDIKLLAGYSEISNTATSISAYRERFYNNAVTSLGQGTNDGTRNNNGTDAEWGLRSYFGRINYALDNKYLLEANARYDGSSRFTGNNQYSFFPSFSAGWRLSQENFWRDNLKNIVSEFKLRGSWGKTGNQTVPLYQYYGSLSLTNYTFGGSPAQAYLQNTLNNKDLTWETTRQTDIGFDAQFLKGRAGISFDYYQKRTSGILLQLPIPATVGLAAPFQNAGVVDNNGIELALNYRSMPGSNFRYDLKGNIAVNDNKVVSLAGTGPYIRGSDIDPRYIIKEGLPIDAHWGYRTAGLFQTTEEIVKYGATYAPNTKPGDVKYLDLNNDGKIDANDMTMIGVSFPKYTFGLATNFGYKNFELNLLFQGAAGVDTRLAGALAEMGDYEGFTHKIYTNNYWTPTNTGARFPRPIKFDLRNRATSDMTMINGSYVRLKNIQIVYNLPASLSKRISASKASVYVSGTNLLTLSKLNEWNIDPEAESGRAVYYPQTSLLTVGVNIQF